MGNVAGVQRRGHTGNWGDSASGGSAKNVDATVEAATVKTVCEFVLSASWTVHCLQNERGGSSMFSASRGRKYKDLLKEARETTDLAVAELQEMGFSADLKSFLGFQDLTSCRKSVNQLRFKPATIMEIYSTKVESVLTACASAMRSVSGTFVDKEMTTFLILAYMKENCAQLRGNVARQLAGSSSLDDDTYLCLTSILITLKSYSKMFMVISPSTIFQRWQNLEKSMPRMITALEEAIGKSKSESSSKLSMIVPEEWWRLMTKRIDGMEDIMKVLLGDIYDKAQRVYSIHLEVDRERGGTSEPNNSNSGTRQESLPSGGASTKNLTRSLVAEMVHDSGWKLAPSSYDQSSSVSVSMMSYTSAVPSPVAAPKLSEGPVPRDWMIPSQDIIVQSEIGKGATGKTYVGTWKDKKVAVKIIKVPKAPSSRSSSSASSTGSGTHGPAEMFCQEANNLIKLQHRHVLGLCGVCISPPSYCIILEHMSGGSLWNLLRTSPEGVDFMDLSRQLLEGMTYIHETAGLVHRNLKTHNLLLSPNGILKISDFGLTLMAPVAALFGKAGTARWMGPEVISGQQHSFPADVYSIGIILWELLTKDVPWGDVMKSDDDVPKLKQALESHMRPKLPENTPKSIAAMIQLAGTR
eukprot:CAMPEP_0117651274 /NCGR_PEP_ID=MMETSP0804-20121206/2003_1 /TAXON_ID=1074897 /ORGANISM="Tetraselmis astigmatica, Strain CCMP880" /LENGTH=638 /DNA_ID=CAMNT_0005457237 /DNA_START=84 /DNA_END=2001 /DNA_ORIENTATION=-